jgi:hypothetical protein
MGKKVEPEAELAFWLNAFVAVAAGAVCWIKLDLSAGMAAGLAAIVFVALFASLLHPYAAIVAGVLGSSVAAGIGALLGASFGLRYGGTVGAWGGGIVGGLGFAAVAVSAYWKVVRAGVAARGREKNDAPGSR